MHKNKKLLIKLILIGIFMFGFAFALVPLYDTLCKALGIRGNTTSQQSSQSIDTSRTITIQFVANKNSDLPWDFYPENKQIVVHPGENKTNYYIAKNNSNEKMTVRAVPSVTPAFATQYLKKMICFCFEKQTLDAHQSVKMPMIFYIDKTVPERVHEITLSFTLFAIKPI